MKKIFYFISILIMIFTSCNFHNKTKEEKAKEDSLAFVDTLNTIFSKNSLNKFINKDYKITNLIKMVLADNKDILIIKDKIETKNLSIDVFYKDDRNGAYITITGKEVYETPKRLIVNETSHNIYEKQGLLTSFNCIDAYDKQKCLFYFYTEDEVTNFWLEFDYNKERSKYMQYFVFLKSE